MKGALILTAFLALVTAVAAAEDISVRRGEELFNSTQLGTNGKSCATCHPKGKNLAKAATYGDERLVSIINGCIENPLSGTPLPKHSPEMASLVLYLKTFARQ
ncbi:hypothetical protein GMSM_25940 [Geomonas sp. Red276]